MAPPFPARSTTALFLEFLRRSAIGGRSITHARRECVRARHTGTQGSPGISCIFRRERRRPRSTHFKPDVCYQQNTLNDRATRPDSTEPSAPCYVSVSRETWSPQWGALSSFTTTERGRKRSLFPCVPCFSRLFLKSMEASGPRVEADEDSAPVHRRRGRPGASTKRVLPRAPGPGCKPRGTRHRPPEPNTESVAIFNARIKQISDVLLPSFST